jgi:acyl-coenzyme A thioesterase PaaI-like protein
MSIRGGYMIVIADVIFTVAIVASAPGAVAELQLRIGNIRPAADGTAMIVRCFGSCYGSLIGSG